MKVINIVLLSLIVVLVIVSCQKEISTSPGNDPIYNGAILIDSNPQGAEIFINRGNTGKFTPDSILHLEPGQYNIKIRLYPYLDILDSLDVEDNITKEFSANFFGDTRNFGSITVSSSPTASVVYLRDSCLNVTTPYTIEHLWPGLYSIGCTYPEHRRKNTYVLVRGGESKSTTITLQDTTVFVDYMPSNSDFPYIRTICIEVDDQNNKWVGLPGTGLIKYTDTEVIEYNSFNSELPNDYVNCIVIDNLNKVWVGTSHGLAIIDNGVWAVYTIDNSDIPHDAITCIDFDSQGNAWIGASDPRVTQLLLKFDGNTWSSYPAGNAVITVCVDNDDAVWVGLNQGFRLFKNGTWINITNSGDVDELLRDRTIESIAKDIDGRMWICAGAEAKGFMYFPGGLFVYENNSFRKVDLPENIISHIHINNNGTKWISCFGKYPLDYIEDDKVCLIKIDADENTTAYTREDNLPGSLIRCSSSAPNGDLWMASRDRGIIKFKGANL